jgi:hypothetical protein
VHTGTLLFQGFEATTTTTSHTARQTLNRMNTQQTFAIGEAVEVSDSYIVQPTGFRLAYATTNSVSLERRLTGLQRAGIIFRAVIASEARHQP